jgi:hypothetical protein
MLKQFMIFMSRIVIAVAAGVLLNFNTHLNAQEQAKGIISGTVRDKTTKSPMIGATVIVTGTQQGAIADTSGYFTIPSLEIGTYNLEFSYVGYEKLKKANVVVNPNRHTILDVEIEEKPLSIDDIVIRPTYFEKAKYSVVSNRSMDFEEIRSDPGSVEDVQRVVQALPGIISMSDEYNEIIVRGGIPGENLFVIDNIEIPNPNHFPIQGMGGGPINMINTYFVRDIDFYAGAFPAKYGDKVSSVMDIKLRDGNRIERTGNMYLGMAGIGAMAEGPLANGKVTYIVSGRKSYLDLIAPQVQLTAIPKYYNLQSKITSFISNNNKLTINALFGNDRITIEDDEDAYSRGGENVKSRSHQYTLGATLLTLLGKKGFSTITISRVLNDWNNIVYHNDGHIYYNEKDNEAENTLKADIDYKIKNNIDFSAGINIKNTDFSHNKWFENDTVYIYNYPTNPKQIIAIQTIFPELNVRKSVSPYKSDAYAQVKFPINKLDVIWGLRYHHFTFTDENNLSPRVGLTYHLTPKTDINAAFGNHYQSPAYIDLTLNPANRNLNDKTTRVSVLGIEHRFADDLKGTLEIYYKDYKKVPVSYSDVTPDPLDSYEWLMVNKGEGCAKGIELFLQKKLSNSWHSTVSYSYSVSRARDLRYNTYYNWDFDHRHVFTLIAGYKARMMHIPWYTEMKKKLWYKPVAWLLPFGDEVVTSVRFRYLGGRPYTAPKYHPEFRRWLVDSDQMLNHQRFPHYARLDIRIDRRFFFKNWNMVTYFDMINILNRDNIWDYSYNEDGTRDKILQYKVLPVGGVTIEF